MNHELAGNLFFGRWMIGIAAAALFLIGFSEEDAVAKAIYLVGSLVVLALLVLEGTLRSGEAQSREPK